MSFIVEHEGLPDDFDLNIPIVAYVKFIECLINYVVKVIIQ